MKKLFELGLLRGFVTYEEVHSFLPDHISKPEHIDKIMYLLEYNNIEVIEDLYA